MSTASRYWGTFYGACGWGFNASSAPGDSGKTLVYYDTCAHAKIDGQLGSLDQLQVQPRKRLQNFAQMWPKFFSEAEIAVQWSFGSTYSYRFSPARRAKLPHSPPLFPRAQAPPCKTIATELIVLTGA
jgi:hypothetical protein